MSYRTGGLGPGGQPPWGRSGASTLGFPAVMLIPMLPRPWRVAVLFLSAAMAVGIAIPAHASITRALDLAALVQRADRVVVGTVERADAHWDAYGRIVTDATVRIEESVKGPASDVLTVRCLGGNVGDVGMRVEGEATLDVGGRFVLFTTERAGHRRVVGMSQGAMRVQRDQGRDLVYPGGAGLLVVDESGGIVAPGQTAGAPTGPKLLADLVAEIRTLAAEERP